MYEPDEYWERLLSQRDDLTGVGHPEMPVELNAALYRVMRSRVLKALASKGVPLQDARVLDVGSGTGFWLAAWRSVGARRIMGLELTAAASQVLRQKHPDVDIVQGDISAVAPPVDGEFDVVSAMSVLLHVVEDDRWRRALDNLCNVLTSDGWLLIIDPAVRHRWWGEPLTAESNSVPRPLASWEAELAHRGLRLHAVVGVSALLNNVADTKHRWTFTLLSRYWYYVRRLLIRFAVLRGPFTKGLEMMDRGVLMTGWSPSSKLLLFRRI